MAFETETLSVHFFRFLLVIHDSWHQHFPLLQCLLYLCYSEKWLFKLLLEFCLAFVGCVSLSYSSLASSIGVCIQMILVKLNSNVHSMPVYKTEFQRIWIIWDFGSKMILVLLSKKKKRFGSKMSFTVHPAL
jgi:hypothetical protein